ncbi:MAG: malectin domain-containing carbohydrate-binding protein [Bacteroidota bacterium]
MKKNLILLIAILLFASSYAAKEVAVLIPKVTTMLEKFAAKEVRRYVYLRTGLMAEIINSDVIPDGYKNYIILGRKDRALFSSLQATKDIKSSFEKLNKEEYLIKTISTSTIKQHIIIGGDETGVLYGVYKFIESLGVRYYLDGDVIPDAKFDMSTLNVNETGKPLFNLRGIQPFHDFPEGPDWWNVDDYKAIIAQLPKLRMNFIGLHTYPEGAVGPEPTVWIGEKENVGKKGFVNFSYPSTYNNSLRNAWGYGPKTTGSYDFGADKLFETDIFGADVQRNMLPLPKIQEEYNNVFNNTAVMLNNAFNFAHSLGVKTCVGTETPLIFPALLKEKLKNEGKDINDNKVKKDIYKGIFNRVKEAYPVDYYWLWTPEDWTWSSVADTTVTKTKEDIQIAYDALKESKVPFNLATCGWVLGPPKDRAEFDRILPKDIPFSCINRNLGHDPVEPQFEKIMGRDKWAIPWMEEDPLLTQVQLWAGRMRMDAVDALKYKCTGLMGIHWRTRILGPNVSALAYAAWDQNNFKAIKDTSTFGIEVLGGNIEENPATILNKNAEEQYLYKTFRGGMEGYNFMLPNGKYKVTIKMVECYYDKPDSRVFNIFMQGKKVIENLDITARAGRYNALDCPVNDVEVTDGKLMIRFGVVKDIPNISAIVIEGNNYIKKINCGGDAYMGYISDVNASNNSRYLAVDDFYLDWAEHNFGKEASHEIAKIFTDLDGKFPCPTYWVSGPGTIKVNRRDVKDELVKYKFVDEFNSLRNKIKGTGNLDRFDYWLNTFKYYREMLIVGCAAGALENVMDEIKKEDQLNKKKEIAQSKALPLQKELVDKYGNLMKYLLSSVTNMSELGTIMNIENLSLSPTYNLISKHDSLLRSLGCESLSIPSKDYKGELKIIVPSNRTSLSIGEDLNLKIIILGEHNDAKTFLFWKTLGSKGDYKKISLSHVSRGVYNVVIPAKEIANNDFEYYISTESKGKVVKYPATSPEINRTVVLMEKN